jgi:hypothetical protein
MKYEHLQSIYVNTINQYIDIELPYIKINGINSAPINNFIKLR